MKTKHFATLIVVFLLLCNHVNAQKTPPRDLAKRKAVNTIYYNDLDKNIISGGVMLVRNIGAEGNPTGKYPDAYNFLSTAYIAYERELLNSHLGLKAVPFIGLNKEARGAIFEAKYYPRNWGKYRAAIGGQYMVARREVNVYWFDENTQDHHPNNVKIRTEMKNISRPSLMGYFGYQLNKKINVHFDIGFGYYIVSKFGIGYRF